MVKEHTKKYNLYTAAYYEDQAQLLSQYNAKKREIEEYLREVKDIIIDDVRDTMRDKRQSLDACTTVNVAKTPGMTIRRTKRRIQKKSAAIDVDSPNTSIVSYANSEAPGSTASSIKFSGCSASRLASGGNTPTNTMTPNRTQPLLKQTRLQSILGQHQSSVNLTPTGGGRPARLTRARAKLLENSLVNSTICSMQSTLNTPTLKSKLLDKYDKEDSCTPVNAPSTPRNLTTVGTASTPGCQECPAANSTMVQPGTPAANSTMVQPGTPAAPFGVDITLIKSTPHEKRNVGGTRKGDSIVVSSPIGPITTTGTPTSNSATDTDKHAGEWVLSTGKRKSSKIDGRSMVLTSEVRETPIPASTPILKRLQLSTLQPSPAPVATPADKQPALLSLTIAGTPTPENATAKLFPSPDVVTPDGGDVNPDVTRTPNMADIKTQGALTRTPGLSRTPGLVKKVQIMESLAENARGRSGDDLVFVGRKSVEGEVKGDSGLGNDDNELGGVIDGKLNDSATVELGEQDSNKENVIMETDENAENVSMELVSDNKDTSMKSVENLKNVSMESEEKKVEYESEPEAMEVAVTPEIKPSDNQAKETEEKFFDEPIISEEQAPKEISPVKMICEAEEGHVDVNGGDVDARPGGETEETDNDKVDDKVDVVDIEANDGDNDSSQLFESCKEEEEEDEEIEVNVVKRSSEEKELEGVEEVPHTVEECEPEESTTKTPAPVLPPPKTPIPVRKTRSSRNKKLSEKRKEEKAEVEKSLSPECEPKESTTKTPAPVLPPPKTPIPVRKTRSSRNKKLSEKRKEAEVEKSLSPVGRTRSSRTKKVSENGAVKEGPKQGTVKKITASYEHINKQTTNETKIPSISVKKQLKLKEPVNTEHHDISKREREVESEDDSNGDKTPASANESIHLKKRMKDNTGAPRNPPNLMTSVFSLVDRPVVIVKSAKELEEEKKESARRKIEEKEAKAQQVLNKKKQRENEIRLKRIEKDKRMRQAKQYKEDEVNKKKAELEEKMRKKEESSAKEREMLAKKEEEKRLRELKKQEQAEQRRKQAERARELKKKKLQEEAEERKAEALRRKQELDAQKVRELEKHRLDEEARTEEQRKLEADELEKRLKADEERRKLEEEVEKKKTTPSRNMAGRKLNLTATAGTLLGATPPPPRPPPRTNKHAIASKIPTKHGRGVEEAKPRGLEVEEASNVRVEKCPVLQPEKRVEARIVEEALPAPVSKPVYCTPLQGQSEDSVASPISSAATSRIQSYMKTKLLSIGQNKNKRTLGSRLDAISEDHSSKRSAPVYDPRDNYKIEDIESGDETDEESKPKRTIPMWARNKISLNESLRKQFSSGDRYNAKDIFGPYPKTADLDQLFGTVNRYTSRTSSAHWTAPPAKGNLDFSILTEDEITHANNILLKYK